MKSLFRKKTVHISEKKVEKLDSKESFTEAVVTEKKIVEPIFYPHQDIYSLPIQLLNQVYNKNAKFQAFPLNNLKQIRTCGKYSLKQQSHRFILQEEDSGLASKELLHSFDTTVYDSGYVHLVIKDVYLQNVPIKLKLKFVVKCGDFQSESDYTDSRQSYRNSEELGIYVIKIRENASVNIDVYAKFVPEEEMKSALDKFKNRKVKAQFADHLRQFSGRSQRSFNLDQEFKIGSFMLDLFACNVQHIKKTLSINIGELLNSALLENRMDAKYDNATCEVTIDLGLMQLESYDNVFITYLDWYRSHGKLSNSTNQ
eukprot:NODE_354_length_10253_cov_0.271519.p3 type:complete len:314 gc:universal NODE_354_length_10253_cov_0.271519:8604-9545(+)